MVLAHGLESGDDGFVEVEFLFGDALCAFVSILGSVMVGGLELLPLTVVPSPPFPRGMRDATEAVITTFFTVGVRLADSKIEVVPLTAGVRRSSFGFASGEATWIT